MRLSIGSFETESFARHTGALTVSDCAAAVCVATKIGGPTASEAWPPRALAVPAGMLASVGCPATQPVLVPLILLLRQSLIVDSASICDPYTAVVTDAFTYYSGDLVAVYSYATTPDQVANATWAVVNQAAADGLDAPDRDGLAGIVSLSISSAYQ